jgi:mRNA interferase RelE/StbE
MFEHEGHYSARRGPYRILYELDEEEHVVRVVAIGHRREVYRRR